MTLWSSSFKSTINYFTYCNIAGFVVVVHFPVAWDLGCQVTTTEAAFNFVITAKLMTIYKLSLKYKLYIECINFKLYLTLVVSMLTIFTV